MANTNNNNNKSYATIAHLTDIHMNFPSAYRLSLFFEHCRDMVKEYDIDCFVLTGDISEAPAVVQHVEMLRDFLDRPCYFVCGNHDFYHGSILDVRKRLTDTFNSKPDSTCVYLSALNGDGYVTINQTTAIVGHDGWYDGVYADWHKSKLNMNDYHIISELAPLYHMELFAKIQELSMEGAAHVFKNASLAIAAGHTSIVIATHVPPFAENSVYNGKISDNDWLPHFSSGFMGRTILGLANDNPNVKFTVLCGHSHGEAQHSPKIANNNVICFTGKAEYGSPQISKVHLIDM